MVAAASYPPLHKTQGRGTRSFETGEKNFNGGATRPAVISPSYVHWQLNRAGSETAFRCHDLLDVRDDEQSACNCDRVFRNCRNEVRQVCSQHYRMPDVISGKRPDDCTD
jgi:hypothetical protein